MPESRVKCVINCCLLPFIHSDSSAGQLFMRGFLGPRGQAIVDTTGNIMVKRKWPDIFFICIISVYSFYMKSNVFFPLTYIIATISSPQTLGGRPEGKCDASCTNWPLNSSSSNRINCLLKRCHISYLFASMFGHMYVCTHVFLISTNCSYVIFVHNRCALQSESPC